MTVKTIAPEPVEGRLIELSLTRGLLLRISSTEQREIPLGDLVRISASTTGSEAGAARDSWEAIAPQGPSRTAAGAGDIRLALVGGDVLYGRPADAGSDVLGIETADLGPLEIPLDAISAITTARAVSPAFRRDVASFERAAAPGEDCILLTNGDRLCGFITSMSREAVAIEGSLGEQAIPFALVVAVRFAIQQAPPIEGPAAVLQLRHSGRLTAVELTWTGNEIAARLRHGPRIRFSVDRLEWANIIGGRWEWLSHHDPISSEHTPMLSLPWEHVNDANVLGEPMFIAGKRFEHGVGVHSRSKLIYDLAGRYREFVTFFGLDDHSGPYADVNISVLVDGQPSFTQSHVRPGVLFASIRIEVAGASRLELLVEFGANGDLQDRFNWADAALIR